MEEEVFGEKKIENLYFENIKDSYLIKKKISKDIKKIFFFVQKIFETISNNKKVFICGNGGSASDAQHLAAEFLVRLNPKINRRPYPIISLALDPSSMTACGNDYGFKYIFSRNLEAISSTGDLLIVLSTSGHSQNILEVLKKAKQKKLFSLAFLGSGGGKAKKLSNNSIIVPSKNVARIQETHIFLGHFILNLVEKKLLKINF